METNQVCMNLIISLLCLSIAANLFLHCDARKSMQFTRVARHPKRLNAVKHTFLEQMMTQLNLAEPLETANTQPYGVSSPFTLPPYDSLPPAGNAPPFCVNPPNTPQPTLHPPPGPIGTGPNPPATVPSPFTYIPSPPSPTLGSSPPGPTFGPSPPGPALGPPTSIPTPPTGSIPSPAGSVPNPPVFLPPIVFPPPRVPPPPHVTPSTALWCVAKPSVPGPIMQEAMNYACGSGADCNSIQPDGPCFKPNTLFAHASFAFNSYWQRTKAGGGSCEFGGTGMLVTVDPSYDGCRFDSF